MNVKEAYKVLTSDRMLSHVRFDAFKRDWDDNQVITITRGFTPVAVLTFKVYRRRGYGNKGDMQLKQMAVNPDNRRQGLGTALIDTLVQYAITLNCPRIVLSVRKENLPARKLYKKLGFRKFGTVTWKQKGKDLPGLLYELRLYHTLEDFGIGDKNENIR